MNNIQHYSVKYEVLIAQTMRNIFFLDAIPCTWVGGYQCLVDFQLTTEHNILEEKNVLSVLLVTNLKAV
jgi:hypothetical protein